jgi:hypothetical protein
VPVTEVSAREAAAVALAVAAELPALPKAGDEERIGELIERTGAAQVVTGLCAALAARD